MKKTINSKPAQWTGVIEALWKATEKGRTEGTVWLANFHTVRPYRNEYDRGTTREGFVYIVCTDDGPHVCTVDWERKDRQKTLEEGDQP